jgi:hypothetical protein
VTARTGVALTVFLFIALVGQFSLRKNYGDRAKYLEELKNFDLNGLCAGTRSCSSQEISDQEKEEQWIIQSFQMYF